MSRIATGYLALAALYLVVGLSLGIGMGIAHEFRFASVHAHINLVGWVTHALMGLTYRQWPDLQRGKLAVTQFAIYALSAPIFMVGLILAVGFDLPIVAIVGALGVFLGAILFAYQVTRLWISGEQV